jgi:preprotein translocase subunit SecD
VSRLRLRVALVSLLMVVVGYFAFTNFVPEQTRRASGLLPDEGLRLGLDLQGGIHWVLSVRLQVAEEHELGVLSADVERAAEEEGWALAWTAVEGGRLVVDVAESDAAAVRGWVTDNSGAALREADAVDGKLAFELTDDWRQDIRERGMAQVLEVLRRRIDDPDQGIPQSVVTRQGEDRVLVQIPGGQIDRSRARELLRTTGFLEFKIVQATAETRELLEANYPEGVPEGAEILFERDKETQRVLGAYLVPETPDITGKYLTDARVGFDPQQRPLVNFTFDTQGGKIFQELTEENINERLAIILDDQIYSAPVIQSRISMRGQITGRFTSQEAADLAVVLRAGSLAVPVVIEEERTVGPALGADSIARGVRASILGLVLIVAFAAGYYRLSGGYASLALIANLVLLIGIMSLFDLTLTLPGIAGIVLTVGMAVDANVIIFERIREELRAGKTPRAAIGTGFNKALWTILDANITTLITAIVLFEVGSGPIKGFAVTLGWGIVTSVFAALVITRLMFQIYPGMRHVESLSI